MKRPVLYVLFPFILGIAASQAVKFPPLHVFIPSVILFVAALVFSGKKIFSHVALYAAVFLFGIFYCYTVSVLPPNHISRFLSDRPLKVFLSGVVGDDPVESAARFGGTKTDLTLKVGSVKIGDKWHSATGLVDVAIYAALREPLRFGQKVALEGNLKRPSALRNPGLFDYEEYLAIKDIYAVFTVSEGSAVRVMSDDASDGFRALAYSVRSHMRKAIDSNLKAPYNGFIKAIMIGDRTDLKYSLNNDFVKTGTVHAIAISGLNVGMIAAIVLFVLSLMGVPRKASLAITAAIMVVYAVVAGSSPPIVRAVIIFVVFVIGYLMNRETELLNSLAFTAFVMLLANPKELFDPSFQLSFVSIAGMILLVPKIDQLLNKASPVTKGFKRRALSYLSTAVSVSIAAWLATWPIVAKYFNIVSPVSLIANLVVVPALFILTAVSFMLIFASLVSAMLAGIIAKALSLFSAGLFVSNHYLSGLPFAFFRIPSPSPSLMALYYMALPLLLLPSNIRVGEIVIRKSRIFIAILVMLNIIVWTNAVRSDDDSLGITFLDVGQGDSALVELPGGRTVLIDAGPGGDEDSFDAARSVIAPYLWNRNITRIDALVITHFHDDHLGGAAYIIDNFEVGRILDNGSYPGKSLLYDRFTRLVKDKKIPREILRRGDSINFRGGSFYILSPGRDSDLSDSNENSVVLKLNYGNFSALFCADLAGPSLRDVIDIYGKALGSRLIKVPHHGGSIGDIRDAEKFFITVGAKVAVISVAKNNRYGSPSEKTLDILERSTPLVYTTSYNGAINVTVTRRDYRVKPYIENN